MQLLLQLLTTTAHRMNSFRRLRALRILRVVHRKAFSQRYLLLTNVSISMGLSCTGDILEQQYERYCGELDNWERRRTAHMSAAGVVVGAICHCWYKILDRRLPGRTLGVVMQKIILDQIICSPVYITVFFITTGMLERQSTSELWTEIKEKAWRLYIAEWFVWPVAQYINFHWLPTKYRVLYDNVISLGYDVYTSQVKHSKLPDADAENVAEDDAV